MTETMTTLADGINRLRNVCDPTDVTLRSVIECSIEMIRAASPEHVAEFARIVDSGS